MNEQAHFNLYVTIMLVLVIVIIGYDSWRVNGEIDNLHARIDAIDGRPVARILRARDDATAETVAREGA